MDYYLVSGVDDSGNQLTTEFKAGSKDAAAKLAREQGVFPTSVRRGRFEGQSYLVRGVDELGSQLTVEVKANSSDTAGKIARDHGVYPRSIGRGSYAGTSLRARQTEKSGGSPGQASSSQPEASHVPSQASKDSPVVKCPKCESLIANKDPALRGKDVDCPKCGERFRMPTNPKPNWSEKQYLAEIHAELVKSNGMLSLIWTLAGLYLVLTILSLFGFMFFR